MRGGREGGKEGEDQIRKSGPSRRRERDKKERLGIRDWEKLKERRKGRQLLNL